MTIEREGFTFKKLTPEEITEKNGISKEELGKREAKAKKIAAAAKEAGVDVPTYKKMLEKGGVELATENEDINDNVEKEGPIGTKEYFAEVDEEYDKKRADEQADRPKDKNGIPKY